MANVNELIKVGCDVERSVAGAFTGSAQSLGAVLTQNPVIIIFDNQSTVPVAVSIDGGVTTWKTFSAGQALVLDLRANHGQVAIYSFPIGTQFSVTASGGTGSFRLSITYAR